MPIICYDRAMSRKPGNQPPPNAAPDATDGEFDAQMAAARAVMARRKRALRALAK
jgi:hypothetical protein